MQVNTKDAVVKSILLSVISPFIALLASFSHVRTKSAKVVFFLFCVWIGAIFIFNTSNDKLSSGNVGANDGSKIALQYYNTHIQNPDFETYYNNREEHDSYDFFQILSIFFLTKISGNPRLWFIYVSLIYGFFCVSNLWFVLERCEKPITWYCALFMGLFLIMMPITEGLNATRMNLAIQVFLFGLLPYLVMGNKKRIWVSFLCVLIHFSMFMALVLLLLFFILPKRSITLYCILFFVSFFINQLDIEAVKNVLEYLPFGLGDRTGGYLTDASIEGDEAWKQQSSLIYTLNRNALSYLSFILVLVFLIRDKGGLLKRTPWYNLLCFGLFFAAVANVLALLPSGYRFLRISNFVLFAWFLLTINNINVSRYKILFMLLSPLIVFKIVFSIRMMFDYVGLEVFWGNYLTTVFVNDNTCISKILGLSY